MRKLSELNEDEFSENEHILVENDEFEYTDTDDEEENIGNTYRRRKGIRLPSSSEEEVEKNEQHVAIDGSVWKEIRIGGTSGRSPLHNNLRQEVGPTGYAKRYVMKEQRVRSRFPAPSSLKQLTDILVEEWDNIPLETIQKLYESIPRRIEAVLQASDGSTTY
ncbi:hypothetical protein QE152_g26000 [Popillia japonica]|uniref:Uncharacterized protein n=1 Tax=Popillia japonica TaxID=7064 RepID=A0AAW1K073_POPJA